jgi:hypothetical protein
MFMTTAPKPDHPPDMSVHLVNRLMFHPQIITQDRMVDLVMCIPSGMFMIMAPQPDHSGRRHLGDKTPEDTESTVPC